MDYQELIDDLRCRINPQYVDCIGTESYERKQCLDAIESLLAENKRLINERNSHAPEGRNFTNMQVVNMRQEFIDQIEHLKAELAKYRDAPVVAYLYKYRNCFGDEVCTTDHNWRNRIPFESKPLIVKPDENK